MTTDVHNLEHEWRGLISRIVASPQFSKAKKRRELLLFLFESRNVSLSAKEIEEMFFGEDPASYVFDPGGARVACQEVKYKLEEYARGAIGEKWTCKLPHSQEQDGYRLIFEEAPVKRSACHLFWSAHLKTIEDVVFISGAYLFFFKPEDNLILRYSDVNLDQERSDPFEAASAAHPDKDWSGFQPWRDTYLANGDVRAHESLMRWFHRESGTLIPRFTSRELSQDDVHRRTPILTGRPQTNPLIRKMMSSPHAAHLGYRIHSSRGTVKIDDIDMGERQALAQFVISKEGVVGPVTGMGFVFGIVSRIRNPSGYGHVTIVACDYYPMVIARIVELLTSEKHARSLLERMGWRLEDELPDSSKFFSRQRCRPAI